MSSIQKSLETQILNVRHRLGQHLTQSYLNRLLDHINESDYIRIVLQAVIMILGYNYMSDRSLHIVFSKKSTIKRIKKWDKCKLNKSKIYKIKNWMEFRPETFGEVAGYKGDKLLYALRDWCLIMVKNTKPIKKKIATKERQTQSAVTPKSIQDNQSKHVIGKSNKHKQTSKVIANICKASKSVTKTKPTVVKSKQIKKYKTNITFEMNDKCVDAYPTQSNIGVQVGKYKEQTIRNVDKSMDMTSGLKHCYVARLKDMRHALKYMNGNVDQNLNVLIDAHKELIKAKHDMQKLKRNNNEFKIDEDKWRKQREFVLKKICNNQIRLQHQLNIKQSAFFQ